MLSEETIYLVMSALSKQRVKLEGHRLRLEAQLKLRNFPEVKKEYEKVLANCNAEIILVEMALVEIERMAVAR